MRKRHRILVFLAVFFNFGEAASLQKPGESGRKVPSEMLFPIGSTTALMCEPLFLGNPAKTQKANWYKDGRLVATVTNTRNADYEDRPSRDENALPEVGFLVIRNISRQDEGLYWCSLDDQQAFGELFALTVAYVATVSPKANVEFMPRRPHIGGPLLVVCPPVQAVPKTTVSWKINGKPLSRSESEPLVLSNSSLLLRRLDPADLGVFECRHSNFAQETRILGHLFEEQVDFRQIDSDDRDENESFGEEETIFHRALLWFIVSCLTISAVLLLYLLLVVFCLKNRSHQSIPSGGNRPACWPNRYFRTYSLLSTGLRKPIHPQPDYILANNRP